MRISSIPLCTNYLPCPSLHPLSFVWAFEFYIPFKNIQEQRAPRASLRAHLFKPAPHGFQTTPGGVGSSQCLLLFVSGDLLIHQLSEKKQKSNLNGLDKSYSIGYVLFIKPTEKVSVDPHR